MHGSSLAPSPLIHGKFLAAAAADNQVIVEILEVPVLMIFPDRL